MGRASSAKAARRDRSRCRRRDDRGRRCGKPTDPPSLWCRACVKEARWQAGYHWDENTLVLYPELGKQWGRMVAAWVEEFGDEA